MKNVPEIISLLFRLLRQMDAEANTCSLRGIPRGLTSYGWHARPDLKRPQSEVEWSRRLKILLQEHGLNVRREVQYPSYARGESRRSPRCDLVIETEENRFLWLEIKGAWRDYWTKNGGIGIYRCYLFHPLVAVGRLSKSHTVPNDLCKLDRLRPPECHHVAELLIGFEEPSDPMTEDIAELVTLANLDQWDSESDAWLSPTVPNQRVRCWLWHKPTNTHWATNSPPLT